MPPARLIRGFTAQVLAGGLSHGLRGLVRIENFRSEAKRGMYDAQRTRQHVGANRIKEHHVPLTWVSES